MSSKRTEWHRIVFFNRLSEIAAEYLRKGSKVYVEGSLRTRKWQDQSGQDRYTTEIVAQEMQMLDSRGSAGDGGGYQSAPAASSAPAAAAAADPAPIDSRKTTSLSRYRSVASFRQGALISYAHTGSALIHPLATPSGRLPRRSCAMKL